MTGLGHGRENKNNDGITKADPKKCASLFSLSKKEEKCKIDGDTKGFKAELQAGGARGM